MKAKIILVTLWVLSLVLVGLMTRESTISSTQQAAAPGLPAGATPAEAREQIVVKKPQIVEKIVVLERDSQNGEARSFNEMAHREMSPSDIHQQLPAALRDGGDLMSKNLLIAEMLATLTPENVEAALAVFEETDRNHLNDHHFRMFMFAWGEIDGQAATEYAFFNEEGKKVHFGGSSAVMAWAGQDPQAAKAFVDEVETDNRSRGYMVDALVRGWAKTDLNGAANYVGTMENHDARRKLVEHLAQENIKQRGSTSALGWADQVAASSDDEKYAYQVVNEVAFYAAREDPMIARDWVERNLDSEYLSPRIFEEVADEMTEVDPNAAAAFLDKHFEDERVNGKVIAEMTEEWARTDPVRTAEWLDQYIGHEKVNHEVVHELAGEWAGSDPDAAIDWVAGLDDKDLQKRGLASVVDRWAREDTAAVGEWLNQQTQRGDMYDPAIEIYANRIAHEAPVAALSWAQQITDDGRRERTTVRAGQAMYRQDRDAVMAWLPSSGLSERAQQAIQKPPQQDRGRGGDRRR